MAHVLLVTLYDRGALGVRHLSASLKAVGHRVSVLYFKRYRTVLKSSLRNPPPEAFHEGLDLSGRTVVMAVSSGASTREHTLVGELAAELRPDLVGVSTRSITMRTAAEVTRELRRALDAPIVWGGIGPTLEPERSLESADYVCVGEGDGAMLDMAQAIDAGRDFAGIANIWGGTRHGAVGFRNEPRPLIRNLDALPPADMAAEGKFLIDDDRLVRDDPAVSNFGRLYEIVSSRGCPFACTYCCNEALHRLYAGQPRVRRRSVDHVIDELAAELPARRIDRVNFQDDVFSMQPRWLEEFAQRYKQEVRAPFWCYVHPTGLKADVLERLRDAGLRWATLGIQSGSARILEDVYGRRDQRQAIVDTARLLVDLGIDVNVDIISNNPLETEADCRDTLEMLLALPKPVRLNAGISKLSVFPGTRIGEKIEQMTPPDGAPPTPHDGFNILYLLARNSWAPDGLVRRLGRAPFLLRRPATLSPLLWPRRIRLAGRAVLKGAPAVAKRLTPGPLWAALKKMRGGQARRPSWPRPRDSN